MYAPRVDEEWCYSPATAVMVRTAAPESPDWRVRRTARLESEAAQVGAELESIRRRGGDQSRRSWLLWRAESIAAELAQANWNDEVEARKVRRSDHYRPSIVAGAEALRQLERKYTA